MPGLIQSESSDDDIPHKEESKQQAFYYEFELKEIKLHNSEEKHIMLSIKDITQIVYSQMKFCDKIY